MHISDTMYSGCKPCWALIEYAYDLHIPDEVMEELVSTLIKEVIRVASIVDEKTDDESRQSSPQSETPSLPAVASKDDRVFRVREGYR